jgi:CRISPR-associated endonuclease/helicase Cas3
LHDIGKAHAVFQDTMVRCADDGEQERVEVGQPWAKSGGSKQARHKRPFFRHELASALALLAEGSAALDGVADPDLVVYLVAAHHGRVRLGIRTVPDEERRGTVLGIVDGEVLPAVDAPSGAVPASRLSLAAMALGRTDVDVRSWTERALTLLGRPDLGPFRLGFLEGLVRVADWRASAGTQAGAAPA